MENFKKGSKKGMIDRVNKKESSSTSEVKAVGQASLDSINMVMPEVEKKGSRQPMIDRANKVMAPTGASVSIMGDCENGRRVHSLQDVVFHTVEK